MSDDKKQWNALAPKPGSGKAALHAAAAQNISQNKLQAFTIGMQKKTPFQKHKEEAEQKKKKESEEAAKVYAEFVASFENENGGGKAFVRGETIVPKNVFDRENANRELSSPGPAKKILYKPMAFVKAVPVQKLEEAKDEEMDEDEDLNFKREEREKAAKKKRNLDSFLEEIKREQEEREDRLRQKHAKLAGAGVSTDGDDMGPGSMTLKAAFETFDKPGSHDTGDTTTTNLYVGNINPLTVNEEILCKEFAKYGPIASVKIMWPRTQEEKDRNRNCGFVSFMERKHAEQALRNLDGKELLGYVMRVGWGKAVPIPPQPIYELKEGVRPPPSGLPFNAQMVHPKYTGVPPPGPSSKPRAEVQVVRPEDPRQTKIIHRMVERVIRYGPMFEALMMDREWNHPKFKFLFDNESPEHVYYRWKLYSILQGDRKNHWRTEPFQMFDEGPWWVPPEIPFDEEGIDEMVNSEEEDEREREHIPKGVLGKKAKQRLEIMLRRIGFQRGTVAKAMTFAIDHADAADEVVDIVTRALMLPDTPVATKIARLYLVSDILHNSSVPVPNAWKYRSGFEVKLPDIFEHLNQVFRSITARLKAEQFRRQVTNILTVWENWIVFPQHYIAALSKSFMKRADGSQDDDANGDEGDRQDTGADNVDGERINDDPMDVEEGNGRHRQQVLPVKTKWDNDDDDNGTRGKVVAKTAGEIDDMFA